MQTTILAMIVLVSIMNVDTYSAPALIIASTIAAIPPAILADLQDQFSTYGKINRNLTMNITG
jgi:hypothetical protein